MSKYIVAVYGTLKNGYYNHYLLEDDQVKFLGKCKTAPQFTMFTNGSYPAVVNKGNTSISIEVYEVPESVKRSLDRLEGFTGNRNSHRNHYTTIDINTPFGDAEMYVYPSTPNWEIVKSGEF